MILTLPNATITGAQGALLSGPVAIEVHKNLVETRTAIFSPDYDADDLTKALYRYLLQIVWDQLLPLLIGLCLNPSTATHLKNDNTVDRCCTRARRLGFGGFAMLNAYAFRATDPADMKRAEDPVGPLNDEVLLAWFRMANENGWTVMAGWGAHAVHQDRERRVVELLEEAGVQAVCLGRTQSGAPKHPLYIGYSQPFEPWP